MENNNSKEVVLSFVGILVLILVVVGVSFAVFQYSKPGSKNNTITTGTINMSYDEPQNGINLTDALPISDEAGMALTGNNNTFDFTVEAEIVGTGNTTINYAITATNDGSTAPDSVMKVYLTRVNNNVEEAVLAPTLMSQLEKTTSSELSKAPSNQYVLTRGTFTSSTTNSYRLRMWVDENYSDGSAGGTYKLRVNVYGAAAAQ